MEWKIDRRSRFQNRGINIDPMADWLFRRGVWETAEISDDADDDDPDEPVDSVHTTWVLIRLAAGRTAAQLAAFDEGGGAPPDDQIIFADVTARRWRRSIRIAKIYREAEGIWEEARYCTARVTPVLIEWFADFPEPRSFVESIIISAPPTPVAFPELGASIAPGKPRTDDTSVIMGLIDDGFCLASTRFRTMLGQTRVMASWIQHYKHRDPKWRFGYGRGIYQGEINHHLRRAADEDGFYRAIQLFDPRNSETIWSSRRATHGTHVMDGAAGYEPANPAASETRRPLCTVQLPDVVVADGSGHSLGSYVVDGLRFIVDTAVRAAEGTEHTPAPVVVNLSYGNNAGPHDGSSDLERAMDEIVSLWSRKHPDAPFVIVVPAGNSFEARGHARFVAKDFEGGVTQKLDWEVLPDGGTASLVQIWLPKGFNDRFSLQVTPPNGPSVVISTNGTDLANLVDENDTLIAQALHCPPNGARERHLFQVCIGPTADTGTIGQQGSTAAPHGVWRLCAAAEGLQEGAEVEVWIQRNDLPRGSVFSGRQSRFVNNCNGVVRPDGSFNALATGSKVLVVGGGFRHLDIAGRLPRTAPYSGGGFEGRRRGVDLVAPSEASVVLRGISAAGTRSGARVRLNGTSVAAPIVARQIADRIDLFRQKNAKEVVAKLLSTPSPNGWDERDGWGFLDMSDDAEPPPVRLANGAD